ncbi:hypothetical protein B484DRAFT_439355 [Ochromonadaceae sp. CCMP2298]|nr:hypothetical protein B484DRAFT_439355 [Ochromonadaceae sp. CCMP2298]
MNDDMHQVLPSELNFPALETLPPMKRTQMSLTPDGTAVFTAAGQQLRFVMPSFRAFNDASQISVSGRLPVIGGTPAAGTGAAGPTEAFALTPNAWGVFEQYVVSMGGSQIESILQPALVFQALQEACSTTTELSSKSMLWGTDRDGPGQTTGYVFNIEDSPGSSKIMTFSLPLIGALANLSSALPATSEVELTFTIADIIGRRMTRLGTTLPTAFVLDQLTLTYDVLEMADVSYFQKVTSVPLSLKTSTWLYSSAQLPAGTVGNADLNILARAQSSKMLLMRCSSAVDGRTSIFGSCNPNARSASMMVGTTSIPQTPINTDNPSVVKLALQRAFGAVNSHQLAGSVLPYNFCKRDTADSLHNEVTLTDSYLRREGDSSNWMLAIDLESCTGSKSNLFQGTALTSSSASYMRLDVYPQLQYDTTVHFLIQCDAVLVIDAASQTGRLIY